MCGHVVRYVLRARAASRSRATSKPGARLGRFPPRLLCLLCASSASSAPPQLCFPVSAQELISMDSAERLREPGGIRPPAFPLSPSPPPPGPALPRKPVIIADSAVGVCTPKGRLPP